MTTLQKEIKYCQSCIERGYNPPNSATREWQAGLFYCEDCFGALVSNLSNIAPAEIAPLISSPNAIKGPILDFLYNYLNIPAELQFDKVDTVCRNHEKFFNFAAPAIVNKTEEELAREIEERAMSLFIIKFTLEPLENRIKVLKAERRKAAGLAGMADSREEYSKPKGSKSKVSASQEEKMAKAMGLSLEAYKALVSDAQKDEKKRKEEKFNEMVGNCKCGLARNHDGDCKVL